MKIEILQPKKVSLELETTAIGIENALDTVDFKLWRKESVDLGLEK